MWAADALFLCGSWASCLFLVQRSLFCSAQTDQDNRSCWPESYIIHVAYVLFLKSRGNCAIVYRAAQTLSPVHLLYTLLSHASTTLMVQQRLLRGLSAFSRICYIHQLSFLFWSWANAMQRSSSVCPFVTRWYCDKSNPAKITWSSPLNGPIIPVFGEVRFIWKFEQNHPERRHQITAG